MHDEMCVPPYGASGERHCFSARPPVKAKAGAELGFSTRPSQLACREQTRNFRQSKLLHFPAFCLFNLFHSYPVLSQQQRDPDGLGFLLT